MGKEKFVRSKPHVNAEAESALAGEPATVGGEPNPTESVSFNFAKLNVSTVEPRPSAAADLAPPPVPGDPAIGGTTTISYTGLEDAAANHDTHEIEEMSFTFEEIDHASRPAPVGDGTTEHFFTIAISEGMADTDGPSTLAALEPTTYGGPDSLTGAPLEEAGMLVPAVQGAREAANRALDSEPEDLDLDL